MESNRSLLSQIVLDNRFDDGYISLDEYNVILDLLKSYDLGNIIIAEEMLKSKIFRNNEDIFET